MGNSMHEPKAVKRKKDDAKDTKSAKGAKSAKEIRSAEDLMSAEELKSNDDVKSAQDAKSATNELHKDPNGNVYPPEVQKLFQSTYYIALPAQATYGIHLAATEPPDVYKGAGIKYYEILP